MPRRGSDETDRNAALMVTDFHPWTLNPDEAEDHVPFLGHLCQGGRSCHSSLLLGFNGRVLCLETKRYLHNMFAVARAMLEDVDDEQSDESISVD